MTRSSIDISTFTRDHDFYGEIDLLLTIKSFDLQAIRKRYIASRKANARGKAGSIERRAVDTGGIASLKIVRGQITGQNILALMCEPRAIDFSNGRFAYAAEKTIYIIDESRTHMLGHEWFSYIHTIQLSPWLDDHILIASSGFDIVFEMFIPSSRVTFEWLAWEHGFNEAHDPVTGQRILLTRSEAQARDFEKQGLRHMLVSNPREQVLPTAMRAAFINSVCYDPLNPEMILGTFFHEGSVYRIDRSSGKAQLSIAHLKCPHGGRRWASHMMCTSTAQGEVVVKTGMDTVVYSFSNLEGKLDSLKDLEWLQNSVPIGNLLVTIDSNRTSFVIFEPARKLIDIVPYDQNWAVQDLVAGSLNAQHEARLKQLSL